MTITNMMQSRAALTAQLDATPSDIAHEKEFKEIFDKRWAVEKSILECRAATLDEIKLQLAVLADRAAVGAIIGDDELAALAAD